MPAEMDRRVFLGISLALPALERPVLPLVAAETLDVIDDALCPRGYPKAGEYLVCMCRRMHRIRDVREGVPVVACDRATGTYPADFGRQIGVLDVMRVW